MSETHDDAAASDECWTRLREILDDPAVDVEDAVGALLPFGEEILRWQTEGTRGPMESGVFSFVKLGDAYFADLGGDIEGPFRFLAEAVQGKIWLTDLQHRIFFDGNLSQIAGAFNFEYAQELEWVCVNGEKWDIDRFKSKVGEGPQYAGRFGSLSSRSFDLRAALMRAVENRSLHDCEGILAALEEFAEDGAAS